MARTLSSYMRELRALAVPPVTDSARMKMHGLVDLIYVDHCNTLPWSDSMDMPLSYCCDDNRILAYCENLKVLTVRDLAWFGTDRFLGSRGFGERCAVRLHECVVLEIDDELLSRHLTQDELNPLLHKEVFTKRSLRAKGKAWIHRVFDHPLRERLLSIAGFYADNRSGGESC